MNSKLNSVVIVTLALVLSACTATSTTSKVSDDRGVLLADVATADQLSARIQWQQNLALDKSHAAKSVVALGDRIAVVEEGNILLVLNASSGNVSWQQVVADRDQRIGTPVRLGKQIFVASETNFYVFNIETGSLDQQFRLCHLANTEPVVDESQVIFGSPNGRVFAQYLRSGISRWEYGMGSAIAAKPVLSGGMLVVVDQAGSPAMLNASTGHIVWRTLKPPYAPVIAQPVIANAITYIACTDQYLYAMDRISGHVIWRYLSEKPLTADPVSIGDRIYQRTADKGLVCLDGLSGEVFWTSQAPGRPFLLRGSNLWLRDKDAIVVVDASTGVVLNTVPLSAGVKVIAPASDANVLYLTTTDGRIMCLALK